MSGPAAIAKIDEEEEEEEEGARRAAAVRADDTLANDIDYSVEQEMMMEEYETAVTTNDEE